VAAAVAAGAAAVAAGAAALAAGAAPAPGATTPGRGAAPAADVVQRTPLATTPPPSAAETFAAELARHRAERPRAIPVTYRPLATAIVGARPVHVSTGTASRRALAKVGKVAATTGTTIHLASPAASAEVIAHELTHVAHPSPVARFFDDDDHSPEERRAEQVAAIMRSAPILPRTTAAAAAGTGVQRPRPRPSVAPASDVVRRTTATRSPATSATAVGGAATISAASLADQITRGGPPSVQRRIGGHREGRAAAPQTPPQQTGGTQPAPAQPTSNDPSTTVAGGADIGTQFEQILELLEARILRELERRGGRFRGGF
jgi:hypothetical protein